ncbi:uncharacterized protein F5891DRAFT_981510 [Suillus fuscotomentosus]|uniref:Uncharacterized protein n=1 Tax=Suillus fuscotomentosus TaxID=1912939 RepID=A0AAD4E5I0_9AGAM|nr:uncharacterized protein F5891DRAFT_981510 [Suillus fuscotomentosus]KAG1898849.1 hypothetical protein F5891DRAFT_981510 [Suillus fuscotomentosus]
MWNFMGNLVFKDSDILRHPVMASDILGTNLITKSGPSLIAILLRGHNICLIEYHLQAETHKDEENCQREQANKALQQQEKARQKASQASECEAYKIHGCAALTDSTSQASASPLVHDPAFTSQTVSTPVRDSRLVACQSVVPPALSRISSTGKTLRLNTLTPEKAAELLHLREAVVGKQLLLDTTRSPMFFGFWVSGFWQVSLDIISEELQISNDLLLLGGRKV